MKTVKIRDKEFELFLTQDRIEKAIDEVAARLNKDLADKDPLFICILNGSFMYASELMKRITIPCEVSFVKVSSYKGVSSTGKIKEIYGLEEDIKGRTIVIVEDIVDTGHTMTLMLEQLVCDEPKQILVTTLLLKPDALKQPVQLDYVALEIPNDFIVGYGLDYDGYGRNLSDIYKLKDQ
ncbi:hypoxanthine phosphoribosyltransferase [Dysgonomonas sp. PFB1-18]|uniref:hypoxanthine phosphoribosyltransferase n=1 Tax=unclassified Dysgonomonas TaxID=2630389 RepID=UPI0024735031|nr:MULTISPECIES: hypoxanthine phosphoribosyltransferase [unclassified Dysgonomonas]MDH6310745.1 hypoxanthine phosphoribosyltransferase [Dysgonomonas sp. PF1-14]MDH6340595.1 hypoxanthine phosphoribosyltransferase [Dysgonomonas sp. PF1-16]MDH6382148.1 hypoxanthine phosphoribosyltransferase [Dysgonomonas sp. PFB1-18]MDH6399492.1 hypoxanthine phosphoribosyltransferase [Dysgonomonas sp. PF1-23]